MKTFVEWVRERERESLNEASGLNRDFAQQIADLFERLPISIRDINNALDNMHFKPNDLSQEIKRLSKMRPEAREHEMHDYGGKANNLSRDNPAFFGMSDSEYNKLKYLYDKGESDTLYKMTNPLIRHLFKTIQFVKPAIGSKSRTERMMAKRLQKPGIKSINHFPSNADDDFSDWIREKEEG